jgi:hypothetical protein
LNDPVFVSKLIALNAMLSNYIIANKSRVQSRHNKNITKCFYTTQFTMTNK